MLHSHLKVSPTFFIGVCLALALLLGGQYRLLGYAGFFGAILLLVMMNKFRIKNDYINKGIFLAMLIVLIGCGVGIFQGISVNAVIGDAVRYYIVLFACFITYNSNLEESSKESILDVFVFCFCVILFLCYVQVGFKFSALETNNLVTTQIGADIMLAIFALMYKKNKTKLSIILILLFLAIQYMAQSRTALIASVIGIGLYFCFVIPEKLLKKANGIFWIWIGICLMMPISYVWLYTSKYSSIIDAFFLRYSGHRFYSGRQFLWVRAFEQIREKPYWGQGVGFLLDTNNLYTGASDGMSVHNFFLYLLMQLGIIGFLIFCYLFYCLWKKYSEMGNNQALCMRAFLMAVLLQQSFSLGLVSGKMGFAVVCWFLLFVGAKEYYG